MVTILVMSGNLATPGLLKIKIFQNKGYEVLIPDYDVINKLLSLTQIILKMWSSNQSLVTVAFL